MVTTSKKSTKPQKLKKQKKTRVYRSVQYAHHQVVDLEVGIKAILDTIEEPEKATRYSFGENEAHTTSLRLRTFAVHGCTCYLCGAKGEYFSIDNFASDVEGSKHMNMWGTNPKDKTPLLFTHDHVIPRSKGGADKIENSRTCCTVCNAKKADTLLEDFSS